MNKQSFCFLQVSDSLLNPMDKDNPADVYFKAIWNHLGGEGYFKPEHYWEIPTWIAELSYCLRGGGNELELFHVDEICDDFCVCSPPHHPQLPDADIYLGSIMDCNKEYFRMVARNNPEKFFYFGGYIGREEFYSFFCHPGLTTPLGNVSWCDDMQEFCDAFQITYRYGTDYSLFKGMKCIPRLTLSNGCLNRCRFCTVPDEITEVNFYDVLRQVKSIKDLDFELVYINDKTFGQASNYKDLEYLYDLIKYSNPKFRGFTIQTTCYQILKFYGQGISLKDLGIVNVELGIESYNDDILKKYNKPQNTGTIDTAINILKSTGVNIIPNIIIGLPGETLHTYIETYKWLLNNRHKFLMLSVTNFVPYVGNDDISTIKKDFNENSTNRSYHTKEEAFDTEVFTHLLFELGMEIIEKTKEMSV